MRKLRSDFIHTGDRGFTSNHVIIIDDDGRIIDLLPDTELDISKCEYYPGILTPGFINAHCHLELSHLIGFIPKHTGLVDFILKVVTGRHFEEDKILAAIEKAEEEMLLNGIVAVGDICNNTLTIRQKAKQRLHYHNFIEVSGFPPSVAETRFEKSKAILTTYTSELGTKNAVLSPHAPYSVSPELFKMLNNEITNKFLNEMSQILGLLMELWTA